VNSDKTSTENKNITQNNQRPVTSPISQGKLVSKVNALTYKSGVNNIINPQNMVFNTEKGSTLNYKFVVDELVKLQT